MKHRYLIALLGLLAYASALFLPGCEDNPVTPEPVTLEVSVDSIAFNGTASQPIQRELVVVNVLNGAASYTTTTSSSRIRVVNGASNAPDTIFVQFITTGLSDGTYLDSLTIDSREAENVPITIPIVTRLSPFMQADPDSVGFIANIGGAVTDTQTVSLSSQSTLTVSISVQSTASWLSVTADADTLPATLELWADPTGLASGLYSDVITVTSSEAGNEVEIDVNLRVLQWRVQQSQPNASIRDIFFSDRNNGWAVGVLPNAATNDGFILTTNDGGLNWDLGETFFEQPIGALKIFPGTDTGWVTGGNAAIRRTINGGATWADVPGPFSPADTIDYQDLTFVSSDTGWITGDSGVVIFTGSAGNGWTIQTGGLVSGQLVGIHAPDSRHVWAVGDGGAILATSNGGALWAKQTPPAGLQNFDWDDVFFHDSLSGFIVGEAGRMIRTDDGGATWLALPQFKLSDTTSVSLTDIFFLNSTLGFAVGGEIYQGQQLASIVIRTTDGGTTWEFLPTGTTSELQTVFFTDPDYGWAAGGNGLIIHTQVGSN